MLEYTKVESLAGGIPSEIAVSDLTPQCNPLLLKRVFDLAFSLCVTALMSPLIIMMALALLLTQGRPIFIKHTRIGLNGRRFSCWKFRTMVVNADKALEDHLALYPTARLEWDATQKLKDDPRITPLGRVLRKASVDEVPQLFNIVLGDMSVVGPRPIVEREIAHYGCAIDKYCRVRPGLTGLWQVSGRSDVSYAYRVQLDLQYVTSFSLSGDIAIIAKTIPAVLKMTGSY